MNNPTIFPPSQNNLIEHSYKVLPKWVVNYYFNGLNWLLMSFKSMKNEKVYYFVEKITNVYNNFDKISSI